MKIRICLALAMMASLSSCVTWQWFVEGEDQEIIVKTNPPLADCTLLRAGVPIAHLYPTPGAVYISKTKNDIVVTCSKSGYETISLVNESGTNGAVIAGIALEDALIGITTIFVPVAWPAFPITLRAWPEASMAGIDNKYESPFLVTLPKKAETAPTLE